MQNTKEILENILSSIESIDIIESQIEDVNCGRKCDFELDELEDDLDFRLNELEVELDKLDENELGRDYLTSLSDALFTREMKTIKELVKEKIQERE